MSQPQYRVVFSAVDGSGPISTTPVDRVTAIQVFGLFAPCSLFAPGGRDRMRVVDEGTWAGIRHQQQSRQPVGGAR